MMSSSGPSWTAEILSAAAERTRSAISGWAPGVVTVADLEAYRARDRGDDRRQARSPCRHAKPRSARPKGSGAAATSPRSSAMVEACSGPRTTWKGQAAFRGEKRAPRFRGTDGTKAERATARGEKCAPRSPPWRSGRAHSAQTLLQGKEVGSFLSKPNHKTVRPGSRLVAATTGAQDRSCASEPTRLLVPAVLRLRGGIGLRLDVDVDWSRSRALVRDAYACRQPKTVVDALTRSRGGTPAADVTRRRTGHPGPRCAKCVGSRSASDCRHRQGPGVCRSRQRNNSDVRVTPRGETTQSRKPHM